MLQGIRIVEIEGLGPGPFAGMMLADLGADVIVVHRPGPASVPGKPDRSMLDRGKRSVVLDLKDARDVARLKRLVASADGLIEGFRPGVMERLGLGPNDLKPVCPRLVYGRMTGWGQDGPRSAQAGHDLNYIGLSGALWYAGLPGQPPVTPATMVGDIGGGALYLVIGMLAALLRARETGQGCVVDAAIVDGSAHMMTLLQSLAAAGGLRETRGASLLDGPHWSRSYACADGGFVSVQCLEPKFHAVFLDLLGLADDADFARQFDPATWPRATERLAAIFAAHPRDHWAALFAGSDACVAPVLAPSEAARDAHMAERSVWVEGFGGLQPRAAPRFDGAVPGDPGLPPVRGADTEAVFAEFEGGAT